MEGMEQRTVDMAVKEYLLENNTHSYMLLNTNRKSIPPSSHKNPASAKQNKTKQTRLKQMKQTKIKNKQANHCNEGL